MAARSVQEWDDYRNDNTRDNVDKDDDDKSNKVNCNRNDYNDNDNDNSPACTCLRCSVAEYWLLCTVAPLVRR